MNIKDKLNNLYKCNYKNQWIFHNLYVMIGGSINNNSFIIMNEDEAVVIDPSFNSEKISKFLSRHKIKKLVILLTHGHYDHVGHSNKLATKFNAKIYIHKNDLELKITQQAKYFEFLDEHDNLYNQFVGFTKNTFKLPLQKIQVKMLETPGHTPGSVCYWIDKYVFSGDLIFDNDIGRTDFDYSNKKLMNESLLLFVKTFKNKNLYLFPGHEEWTPINQLEWTNHYVKKFFKK
ncbi:MBL fold metallo-hydrolase [Mycoplasmoides alvi]|uniref:MBL fold metallo-hydrolase n=1 Tax=Mycoplasmoides alvi TaxID=78580 RepID=UPI00051B1F60|nr:MBL fold metallo-hydrolase [Mycoplasmoides alvi]